MVNDEHKPNGGAPLSTGGDGAWGEGSAPPYSMLVAGDFGLVEEGERRALAEGGVAALLAEARPRVAVTAENLLGSTPEAVTAELELATLDDLRPEHLVRKLDHLSQALKGMQAGGPAALAETGPVYDKLAAQDSAEEANGLVMRQGLAFLGEPRLKTVLENWHGLTLLEAAAQDDPRIQVSLVQVAAPVDPDPAKARDQLVGDDGALHDDLYDVVLFANRCTATGAGAVDLKTLADAGHEFDTVALATLTPDFAGPLPEHVTGSDVPNDRMQGMEYAVYNTLRSHALSRRLGVFWNDVLAVESSGMSPAYYVAAAFAGAALVLRSVLDSGWPDLHPSGRSELTGLPGTTKSLQGREVTVSTRAILSDDAVANFALLGIAALNGHVDRDSVRLGEAPIFAIPPAESPASYTLKDQLVLARLAQLMQAVLPEVLRGDEPVAAKAEILTERFAQMGRQIPRPARFAVVPAASEEGRPLLDIAVELPKGLSQRERVEFKVPC